MSKNRPTEDKAQPIAITDIGKRVVVPRPEFEDWLERFDWTYYQIDRGELPPGFNNIAHFQLACICSDPVLWAQSFLRSPDDPNHHDPWEFFDYQAAAVRHNGDAIFSCGAETGKTRDLLVRSMYLSFTTPMGSGLIGAPESIFYLEIIDMMEDQFAWNPDLEKSVKKRRNKPHPRYTYTNGFKLDFRPSGFDGSAYRGVHVSTFMYKDEAAKDKHIKTWTEFWRAGKPGAEKRLYSVPDGDRSCEFYRLKEAAKRRASGEAAEPDDKYQGFKYINFRKPLMPAPFWSPERKRELAELYVGETSPEYIQNVLGEDGEPSSSVFPAAQFVHLLKDMPEYRLLRITMNDTDETAIVKAFKYASTRKGVVAETLLEDEISYNRFSMKDVLRDIFYPIAGFIVGGADLGYHQDPTEILIKQVIGRIHRVIARVSLRFVQYTHQDEALDTLDSIFDIKRWGIDIGNAGTAVHHNLLRQYPDKYYDERVTAVEFGGMTDAVDEEGNIIEDKKTGKPVRVNYKELSTGFLVKRMQEKINEYPFDPDFSLFYTNHTYRKGPRHVVYSSKDDHLIDADRVCTLAAVLPSGVTDIFV